ncbi:MAG: family 16 glycoside hydrolase, partial [Leadbetterella sp.]
NMSTFEEFRSASNNWKVVGDTWANFNTKNYFDSKPGSGIYLCQHTVEKYGYDYYLFSEFNHQDIDLSFDFMMSAGSNAGIYFMRRYEVQLYDSWGVVNPKHGDCGGIYERWDDTKPEGQKGYEGVPPRLNVSKAPGLWQHIDISFQAPKFDTKGKKISNAKFISVKLNGVIIHENVEVTGYTRAGVDEPEIPSDKMMFQGDHGSFAIRNIEYTHMNSPLPKIRELAYKTYYGSNLSVNSFKGSLKPNQALTSSEISYEVLKQKNDYLLVYSGVYEAPVDGDYTFEVLGSGNAQLWLDNEIAIPDSYGNNFKIRNGIKTLQKGDHPFVIAIYKKDVWLLPTLGFTSLGPGFRKIEHHAPSSMLSTNVIDPIIFNATENTLTRSFVDLKVDDKIKRYTHTISVGSPKKINYTYDLQSGQIIQVWRGGYIDATNMYHGRGDGSSKPVGAPIIIDQSPIIQNSITVAEDTTKTNFKSLGYKLDLEKNPSFMYQISDNSIVDKIQFKSPQGIHREIIAGTFTGSLLLANARKIEQISPKLYAIDDKSYYIEIEVGIARPNSTNTQLWGKTTEGTFQYSILF